MNEQKPTWGSASRRIRDGAENLAELARGWVDDELRAAGVGSYRECVAAIAEALASLEVS